MLQTILAQAQSAPPQAVPRRRHRLIFCAADFHFRHHVLCDDPAAEKAAEPATEVNRKFKNRRPSRDQRRHSRLNFEREREHRARESGRQRKDRDGEISHYKCAEGKLNR